MFTNSSTLENDQFGRVSGSCYGYWNKFCDYWKIIKAINAPMKIEKIVMVMADEKRFE